MLPGEDDPDRFAAVERLLACPQMRRSWLGLQRNVSFEETAEELVLPASVLHAGEDSHIDELGRARPSLTVHDEYGRHCGPTNQGDAKTNLGRTARIYPRATVLVITVSFRRSRICLIRTPDAHENWSDDDLATLG
jgi:hypothetical protein